MNRRERRESGSLVGGEVCRDISLLEEPWLEESVMIERKDGTMNGEGVGRLLFIDERCQ